MPRLRRQAIAGSTLQNRTWTTLAANILCVSSYEKGQEFLRTCKSIGCRVLLLTSKSSRWRLAARILDEMFFMPEDIAQHHLIYTVSYMNRRNPSIALSAR